MIPLRDLRPLSDGTTHWQATGCDPQFLIPRVLPAGWVRIRVRIHSDVRGRMEWYTVDSAGLSSEMPMERRDYVGSAGGILRLPRRSQAFASTRSMWKVASSWRSCVLNRYLPLAFSVVR